MLELVSRNKAKVRPVDHVDRDRWARADPPLHGTRYQTRLEAYQDLSLGNLGATHQKPPSPLAALLPPPHSDADKGAAIVPSRTANALPRVESAGSRMSKISSVPSFGKMREPLSGDSALLSNGPTSAGKGFVVAGRKVGGAKETREINSAGEECVPDAPTPPERRPRANYAEFEEFGSEALITHAYDDLDEDYDIDADASSSRLFRDIGPSISMSRGIDKMRPRRSEGRTEGVGLREEGMDGDGYEGDFVSPQVTLDLAPRAVMLDKAVPPPPPVYTGGLAARGLPVRRPSLSPPSGEGGMLEVSEGEFGDDTSPVTDHVSYEGDDGISPVIGMLERKVGSRFGIGSEGRSCSWDGGVGGRVEMGKSSWVSEGECFSRSEYTGYSEDVGSKRRGAIGSDTASNTSSASWGS